jgi:hypothetical protein
MFPVLGAVAVEAEPVAIVVMCLVTKPAQIFPLNQNCI